MTVVVNLDSVNLLGPTTVLFDQTSPTPHEVCDLNACRRAASKMKRRPETDPDGLKRSSPVLIGPELTATLLFRNLAAQDASGFDVRAWALARALFQQTLSMGWYSQTTRPPSASLSAPAPANEVEIMALSTAACCYWHAVKFLDCDDYPGSQLVNQVRTAVVTEVIVT